MKKIIALALIFVMLCALWACGGGDDVVPGEEEPMDYEVAFLPNVTSLDDVSYSQVIWECIGEYAEEKEITYKYYKPAEDSLESRMVAIEQAVEGGARLLIASSSSYEEPFFLAQDLYPEQYFVLIDGAPHNADGSEYRTADNAVGILYADEQAGYLAGYAAVKEGFTKLGFLGGRQDAPVIRFGYGFAQGANDAAAEQGITVELRYHYVGNFDITPENQSLAAAWYATGTQLIFAAGGKMGQSVMAAAELAGGYVIGVDSDQSALSDTVITSAMKSLTAATISMLDSFYAERFPGGEVLLYGAAEHGVQLPMETSKFNVFTQADYDAAYDSLAVGEIVLRTDRDAASPEELGLENVTIITEPQEETAGN